jgi:hypothetical protein
MQKGDLEIYIGSTPNYEIYVMRSPTVRDNRMTIFLGVVSNEKLLSLKEE